MALPEIMLARSSIELNGARGVSPLNGARGHYACVTILYLQVKDESQGAAEGTRQPIFLMMQKSLRNDF